MRRYAKMSALFLALVLIFSCAVLPAFAALRSGDLDGDNKITARDARLCLRASASLEKLTSAQKQAADVDFDGRVTARDARRILRSSARLEPLPAEGQGMTTTVPGQTYAWVQAGIRVQKRDNKTGDGLKYEFFVGPTFHDCNKESNGIYASFRGTCTEPPRIIRSGQTVTLDLTLTLVEERGRNGDRYFNEQARVILDDAGLKMDQRTANKIIFGPAVSGGNDCCSVYSHGQLSDKPAAKVSHTFGAGTPGQQLGIYFSSCGGETVWTYVWQPV